jgi:hypothetical protein
MINMFNANASTGSITCSTAFGQKRFTIQDQSISFHKEDVLGISRSISSLDAASIRTHKKHLGFTKTLYIDGDKYHINIHNPQQFSELNDYLSITGPKGHEMTYPLNCQSAG